jgi:glycine cleavage system protein P-like pyridoxal-binding family
MYHFWLFCKEKTVLYTSPYHYTNMSYAGSCMINLPLVTCAADGEIDAGILKLTLKKQLASLSITRTPAFRYPSRWLNMDKKN